MFEDIQRTGQAVLGIWNERLNIALEQYDSLRGVYVIRNINTLEFTIFEKELKKFDTDQYTWIVNKNHNFEDYDKLNGNNHIFTWQPYGSQFTIICDVPSEAIKFSIKRPPIFDYAKIIETVSFNKRLGNYD